MLRELLGMGKNGVLQNHPCKTRKNVIFAVSIKIYKLAEPIFIEPFNGPDNY